MGRSLFLITILALLMWGAAAPAADAPAEVPAPDFPGRQYVDSTGCVFLRSGSGWQARLDEDGAPVCGYPPTPRTRENERRLPAPPDPALAMPGMGEAEARLLSAVTAAMQPGDYVGGPAPLPSAADLPGEAGEPAPPVGQQIAAAVALTPVLAGAVAGDLHPDQRLCALLGARPRTEGTPAPLASDASQGFCGPPAAALPGFSYREGAAPLMPARVAAAAKPPSAPAGPRKRIAGNTAPRPSPPARTAAHAGAAPATAGPPLIPHWARWLEVGRYTNPAEAEAALRRLTAAGFRGGRSPVPPGGAEAVLAGPYASRQAIVTARDRLLRAGFRTPVPR